MYIYICIDIQLSAGPSFMFASNRRAQIIYNALLFKFLSIFIVCKFNLLLLLDLIARNQIGMQKVPLLLPLNNV